MSLGTTVHVRRGMPSRRRVPRLAVTAGAMAVILVVLIAFGTSFLHVYRLQRETTRLERVKRNLQEHNAQLREEFRLLHTPAYIERVAREQLGLIKPGEIALMIVRPPPALPSARARAARPSWAARVWRSLLSALRRQTD